MTEALAAEETYVPMIREGRVWEYAGFGGFKEGSDRVPMSVYHFIKFDDCVNVNGETYRRAVLFKTVFTEKRDGSENVLSVESRDLTLYFMRESDAKVYVLRADNGRIVDYIDPAADNSSLHEEVVYDWTLNEGDPWRYGEMSGRVEDFCPKVMYGESVFIGSDKCRVMNFSTMSYVCFIEGIGVLDNGSLGDYTFDIPTHLEPWINLEKPGIDSHLSRVYDNDELVYGKPVEYSNSVTSVCMENDQEKELIYDLYGRAVTERLERGIYIQGGRKIIIK